jgi:hypothetical protein
VGDMLGKLNIKALIVEGQAGRGRFYVLRVNGDFTPWHPRIT